MRKYGVLAIVQARLGSVRLPRKVLTPVLGRPLIEHLVRRLQKAASIDRVVLAIPNSAVNNDIARLAESLDVELFRGSELDVLDRYAGAAEKFGRKDSIIVRVTGDCPLVDPAIVDQVVNHLTKYRLKLVKTGLTFPDGLDVQAFPRRLLLEAAELARDNYDREHVTPYIERLHGADIEVIENQEDLSTLRLTVDEPDDIPVLEAIFQHFGHASFDLADIAAVFKAEPELLSGNQGIERDAGSKMSTGAKLWGRAKRTIPDGNLMLSKRSEMFLARGWPSYFSSARGIEVSDLDGKTFLDFAYMGIGTNALGYGHPQVDESVRTAINLGNMSTLNAPEEVYLAEKLVSLHPWSRMAKFTRSGGEAAAVAVRIARAHSKRDGVAFCGYHGWHDWYLAANLTNSSTLDTHLLPGLEPLGVPRALIGTATPFKYNDSSSLRDLLMGGDVGTVFMEVERSEPPAPGFLQEVRSLADEFEAVLVFDECTSGFRSELGGRHLFYGVDPDIAIFGKALGNGYAINAILGNEAVMDSARHSFISSTFWTERIGPAAGLATLSVMEEESVPGKLEEIGEKITQGWFDVGAAVGLDIGSSGLSALRVFTIADRDPLEARTFITQEMLKKGFLATTAFYASVAHNDEHIEKYIVALHETLSTLSKLEGGELTSALEAGVARTGFSRIN